MALKPIGTVDIYKQLQLSNYHSNLVINVIVYSCIWSSRLALHLHVAGLSLWSTDALEHHKSIYFNYFVI